MTRENVRTRSRCRAGDRITGQRRIFKLRFLEIPGVVVDDPCPQFWGWNNRTAARGKRVAASQSASRRIAECIRRPRRRRRCRKSDRRRNTVFGGRDELDRASRRESPVKRIICQLGYPEGQQTVGGYMATATLL